MLHVHGQVAGHRQADLIRKMAERRAGNDGDEADRFAPMQAPPPALSSCPCLAKTRRGALFQLPHDLPTASTSSHHGSESETTSGRETPRSDSQQSPSGQAPTKARVSVASRGNSGGASSKRLQSVLGKPMPLFDPNSQLPDLAFENADTGVITAFGAAIRASFATHAKILDDFFSRRPVSEDALRSALGEDVWRSLYDLGLAEMAEGKPRALYTAKIICGKLIFSDGPWHNPYTNALLVDSLWHSNYVARMLYKAPCETGVDLGTGSGVLGLVMTDYCKSVVATDVNPRALVIARFNGAVNDARNFEVLASDLFDALPGRTFDRLAFSSPVAEELTSRTWLQVGESILERFYSQLPGRLNPGGIAQVNMCFRDLRGAPFFPRMDRWLASSGIPVQFVFLESWKRTGLGRTKPHFKQTLKNARDALKLGINPLRFQAISRGLLNLRRSAEGHSWVIPNNYHLWEGDEVDGAAGAFAVRAIDDFKPDGKGGASSAGATSDVEVIASRAANANLRGIAREIPRIRSDH